MRLIDRIAQCRSPFVVRHNTTHVDTRLNGPVDFAAAVAACPTRFVLSDELTRLCTALAYSKGATTLDCADLLHVPAPRMWVEWCEAPWRRELELLGFPQPTDPGVPGGRRGALIRASRDGRKGSLRTFWSSGDSEFDLGASSMDAYFDLDTCDGEEPDHPVHSTQRTYIVQDVMNGVDILRRCFRFQFEASWAAYYTEAALCPARQHAVDGHALGTVAIAIPVLLSFFLLLATRSGLPQRSLTLERLNRSRARSGRAPLLDHVEVMAPLLVPHRPGRSEPTTATRPSPRLHHVRGHLVRRGSQLFWRIPHLRGSARIGALRSRTVTWTFDSAQSGLHAVSTAQERRA